MTLQVAHLARLGQQTINVDHEDAAVCLIHGHTLGYHALYHEISNTNGRFAGAGKEERVVLEGLACNTLGGIQTRNSDGGSALNIIVERAVCVAVFV